MATCIDDLASLGQSSALMILSDSVVNSAIQGVCSADGACPSSSRRRLLASTVAYRLRVRRMLLNTMSRSSVAQELAPESASRALKSVKKLSRSPRELLPDAAKSSFDMFVAGSAQSLSDQLRTGGLSDIVSLADSVAVAAQNSPSLAARDNLLLGAREGLQNTAQVGTLPCVVCCCARL
jgi:hypothetical protein